MKQNLEYLSGLNLYNDRDLVSFDYLNQYTQVDHFNCFIGARTGIIKLIGSQDYGTGIEE